MLLDGKIMSGEVIQLKSAKVGALADLENYLIASYIAI